MLYFHINIVSNILKAIACCCERGFRYVVTCLFPLLVAPLHPCSASAFPEDSAERRAFCDSLFIGLDSLQVPDPSIKGTLLEMARYYEYEAYLFSKAISCHGQMVRIAEMTSDRELLVDSYAALGKLWIEKARYDLAYRYSDAANSLSDKYGYIRNKAIIFNNLGKIAYYCGDYTTAQKYYDMLLSLRDSEINRYHRALAINNSTVFRSDIVEIDSMMRQAVGLC